MSPAKHSFGKCDRQTDGQTDGRSTDKVIPMCRYASQAIQQIHTCSSVLGSQYMHGRALVFLNKSSKSFAGGSSSILRSARRVKKNHYNQSCTRMQQDENDSHTNLDI